MTEKNFDEVAMKKERLENEAIEIIARDIYNGHRSGMFDLLDDESGKYHMVEWSLDLDLTEHD